MLYTQISTGHIWHCCSSWGVDQWFGLQVIPFLVLAVGVDNMFILANTLDTTDASQPLPERIGQALSEAGPSITLAATAGQSAYHEDPPVRHDQCCLSLPNRLSVCGMLYWYDSLVHLKECKLCIFLL